MADVAPAPKVGLYYPHIHFRHDEWLKTSILFWDSIERIVPMGYPPTDSPTVVELQDKGLVASVFPRPGDLRKVAAPFEHLLATRGDELRSRYAVRLGRDGPTTVDGEPIQTELLHPKISETLVRALYAGGFATDRADDSGFGSSYIHPKLADLPKCCSTSIRSRLGKTRSRPGWR
jgi:hypothetical protein